MRIGWRTITVIKRFLCERQNALAKKKANLKDISFEIKLDRFNDLLKQINEDICRNNPISPDLLGDVLAIFLKDEVITPSKTDRNRYLVSEAGYQASGIAMESLREERLKARKEGSVPICPLISGVRVRQERPFEQKVVKEKPKPQAPKKKKRQKEVITPIIVHENIKCRECLLVDGYLEQEENCRHCGAELFRGI